MVRWLKVRARLWHRHTFLGDRLHHCVQPEPLGTAPGSKRPPAQGAEAVPSLKADRHRRRTKLDRK